MGQHDINIEASYALVIGEATRLGMIRIDGCFCLLWRVLSIQRIETSIMMALSFMLCWITPLQIKWILFQVDGK